MITHAKTRPAIHHKPCLFLFPTAAVIGLCLFLVFMAGPGFCAQTLPRLDFTLPVPEDPLHKQYLGLASDSRFSLGQIKAQVVIVEIFSMYCPVCQREADNVNTVFELIQSRKDLRDIVKIIGIGAGNSDFEVAFFTEKYAVEFPLFSDGDFEIHKKIGAVRTPHFFGLVLDQTGGFSIFYSRAGEISDPLAFVEKLLNASGIKGAP